MISPELGKALADLGGFALFILTVLVAAVGFYRRWFVLGYFYEKAEARADAAERELAANTSTLKAVVADTRAILRLVKRGRGRGSGEAVDDA